MNQKYLVALAVAAVMVLTVGFLFHPDRFQARKPEVTGQTATETPQLQRLSRRGQMSDITDFLNERVRDASPHVLYIPASGTSGVVWSPSVVITTTMHGPILSNAGPPASGTAAPVLPASSPPQGWAILIARQSNNRVVSSAAVVGGTMDTQCDGQRVSQLVLNVPIQREMAGAAIFDVAGEFIGLVVNCGPRLIAIPHTEVARLASEFSGPSAAIWNKYGMRAGPPTEQERGWLATERAGLFVRQVRMGGDAANAGLRPGDLILDTQVPDNATTPLQLEEVFTIWRNGRTMQLRYNPPYSFETPDRGLLVSSVAADSRLAAAGLQAGDRIIAIGGTNFPTSVQAARLLSRPETRFVIYERDGVLTGALLQ